MSGQGARSLFVDTGAFYALFDRNAPRHERASPIFEGIQSGELPYRPIYTSTYILDELATLVLSHRNHAAALEALDRVLQSAVTIIHPDEADFDGAYEQFGRYDDHEISFTDHMSGVLAADRSIDYVFTFDSDHFRTLGFTAIPDDRGEI